MSPFRIVVDVGCYPHAEANGLRHASIPKLVQRFKPTVLYAFDPWPDMSDYEGRVEGCKVVGRRRAAWTENGSLDFVAHDLGATVMREKDLQGEWRHHYMIRVQCFDFGAFLRTLPEPATVKLDCEGAEFPILSKLVADGDDELIDLLLVEWHDHLMIGDYSRQREELLDTLRCPVEPW